VSVAKNGAKGLANPIQLRPVNKQDGLLQVIIETPKGSRNKFAFDPEQKVFALKKVLPAGMVFPYDFGFLPKTLAPDGDPLDVLLLMDEPAFPGVIIRARLIGVIEGEQIEGKKKTRNDRLLAVAEANHLYAAIKSHKDLPGKWMKELEEFFVNYHRLEGKEYKLLGCRGINEANRLVQEAKREARHAA
jgi:inorganic pyrophosphatase